MIIKKISIEKVKKLENDNEVGVEINGDENKIFNMIFNKINLKIIKLDRVMLGPLTKKEFTKRKMEKFKEK